MADLVRWFTCSSVIALGGFSATSSMLACSSDPATTPAGDDDDDTNKPDAGGKTSTSSSSTTSSTSSSGGDGGGTCNPVGTFTIGKPTYTVTSPGKVCDDFANGGNANATALGEFTITKLANGDFSALKTGAKPENALTLKQAENLCQLGGGIPPEGQKAQDADGNTIDVKLTPTQYYDFESTKIVAKVSFLIDSDPPGAKGAKCAMEQVANGSKK